MKYGDKRDYPPIHIWHRTDRGGDGMPRTTTWSKTVKEARQRYADANNLPLEAIGGEFKRV